MENQPKTSSSYMHKVVPVIGALGGAAVNYAFIDH
jgi:hypothetical protein